MRIDWSDRALRNLEGIYQYIHDHDPRAARRIHEDIRQRAADLTDHPNRGRPGRIAGTRELVVPGEPFIIAYRIEATSPKIQILAVVHGARLWPESFE